VSVWKQSVRACPSPYEKKSGTNARIRRRVAGSGMNESPTSPAAPDTKRRYGRIVTT